MSHAVTGVSVTGIYLSLGQRYHFIAGWLPWLGDALHLLFTLAALFWTAGFLLAPQHVDLPLVGFAAPLAAFFAIRLVAGPLLYWRRVPCPARDIAGAALAGMGLSHRIARGVLAGLAADKAVFHITRRSQPQAANFPAVSADSAASAALAPLAPSPFATVREEAVFLLGLSLAIAALLTVKPSPNVSVWSLLLAVQALPYAAALLCAMLSTRCYRRGSDGD